MKKDTPPFVVLSADYDATSKTGLRKNLARINNHSLGKCLKEQTPFSPLLDQNTIFNEGDASKSTESRSKTS